MSQDSLCLWVPCYPCTRPSHGLGVICSQLSPVVGPGRGRGESRWSGRSPGRGACGLVKEPQLLLLWGAGLEGRERASVSWVSLDFLSGTEEATQSS